MNDIECLKGYKAAASCFRILEKMGPPPIPTPHHPEKSDLKILEQVKARHDRQLQRLRERMTRAEKIIDSLPDPQCRQAAELVFLHGLPIWEAAMQMYCCERSVFLYLSRALEYLTERRKMQKYATGAPESKKPEERGTLSAREGTSEGRMTGSEAEKPLKAP